MSTSRIVRLVIAVGLGLCILACNRTQGRTIQSVLAGIPEKNLRSYDFDPATRLEDRIAVAPDFLLKYLREMDKTEDYEAYRPTAEEKAQLSNYLGLLPTDYKETLRQRLVGIYFIDKWIGSGMADYVLANNKQLYAILVINPETMRHNISEWVTYRERTAFSQGGADERLSVDCGTAYTGLLYLLLHETSHIMDYVHRDTPYVEDDLRQLGLASGETAFTKGVWAAYDTPVSAGDFPGRKDLAFYGLGGKGLIPLSKAAEIYAGLMKSPFVSLYGSRNWAEDFAEFSTWTYFTSHLQQPYRIILSRKGSADIVVEPMKGELVGRRAPPSALQ